MVVKTGEGTSARMREGKSNTRDVVVSKSRSSSLQIRGTAEA